MNRLFSVIFQKFDKEHGVYITSKKFQSKKSQPNRGKGGHVLKRQCLQRGNDHEKYGQK